MNSNIPFATPRAWPVAMPAALLALALLAGCGKSNPAPEAAKPEAHGAKAEAPGAKDHEETAELLKLPPDEAQRANLQVEVLQPQAHAERVTATATVRPNPERFARVMPRVEGRLLKVAVNLGDKVRAGQLLAVLDSVELGQAQAAHRQAAAAQRVAQADHERAQALAAQEIIARRDLLRAQGELDKANAELQANRDRLQLLGASPQGGKAGPSFELRAPLDGVVVEKKATQGELANTSTPLFTVADLSRVWVEASLTEDQLGKVKPGAKATVAVNAYPGVAFEGRVTFVGSLLDKDSRTVPARVEVDNKDGRLKPEMFATAAIETGASRAATLSVPDAAIVLMQGQPTVFLQHDSGYEAKAIEPGDKLGGRTAVKSGLKAGDKVVAAGAYALKARMLKSQISDEH